MHNYQRQLYIETRQRGMLDITGKVDQVVTQSGIGSGLCHIFIHHTSASLTLCENADPSVPRDLERFMLRIIPDGDPTYEHCSEGPDDMPAHIRSILTHSDLTLPVSDGKCLRGTWQGIYLWEHRTAPQRRMITVTLQGTSGPAVLQQIPSDTT